MTQNFKRNWLTISKLTRGIWRILTRALESLKNLHFNGLLLSKVYNVWTAQILTRALESLKKLCFNWLLVAKVYIVWGTQVQSYLSWNWKVMLILKKNWLVIWKRLEKFGKFSEHLKVSKLRLRWYPFVQNKKDLEFHRGVMCQGNEE